MGVFLLYNDFIHKDTQFPLKMNKVDVEELQSSIVKIAQDAAKEGYNQGILTSAEFLRKTASINPQYSGVLNGCARALEDIIKEQK
jgi:hypothetical protein